VECTSKATRLVLALRSKALAVPYNISESQQGGYYYLANALELRNGNKYPTQLYQNQLKSRTQEQSERLREFKVEIELLT